MIGTQFASAKDTLKDDDSFFHILSSCRASPEEILFIFAVEDFGFKLAIFLAARVNEFETSGYGI